MSVTFYHTLHLISVFVLIGYTFYAFAAPAETRKRVLMITGIASLLALVSGVGLLHKLHLGFPGWAIVKIVCWLGVSALTGMAYRKRDKASALMAVLLLLIAIAVVMVDLKAF